MTATQLPKIIWGKHFRLLVLVGILLAAMGLRFWGLCWGAPERVDLHPDEAFNLMKYALMISDNLAAVLDGKAPFTWDTLDPVFLNYPSFLMYLTAVIFLVLHKTGLVAGHIWQAYLVGRLISATFGAATCLVVVFMVEEMGAPFLSAALAGVWMAVMPLHVWDSHLAVTDVLMTFWVVMTLLASLRLIRQGGWREYVFAGCCLGLAVGSKYTAALAVAPIVAGALVSGRPFKQNAVGLVLAAGAALGACFLVAPYSFIRLHDLLAAMAFEHRHTMMHHPGFSLPAHGPQYHKYLYQVIAAWPFSLGFALYASALMGTVWSFFRLDRYRSVLLLFVLVFFGVTGNFYFTPLRYYLPVLVVFLIFTGLWQGEWLLSSVRWQRRAALGSVAVTLLYTTFFTVQTTERFTSDTRIAAGHWLDQYLSADKKLLNISWSRSYLALPATSAFAEDWEKLFIQTSFLHQYDLIQITSLMYNRHYRDGNLLLEHAYDRLRNPDGPFMLVKRFESTFINKNLYEKLDPMFGGYFLSPTLEFYALKPLKS